MWFNFDILNYAPSLRSCNKVNFSDVFFQLQIMAICSLSKDCFRNEEEGSSSL